MKKYSWKACLMILILCCIGQGSSAILRDIGIDPLGTRMGAKAGGMGDAFTAVSDDINSIYYNPACLSKNKGLYFSFQSTKDFTIGQASTIPIGTLGISFISRSYNDFPFESTTADYETSMLTLGYGSKFSGSLVDIPYMGFMKDCSYGLTYKFMLNQRLSPLSGPGMTSSGIRGWNAGLLYEPVNSWFRAGLAFDNAFGGITYKLGATTEVNAGSTMLGLAFNILGDADRSIFTNNDMELLLSIDYSLAGKVENKEIMSIGTEFKLFRNYAIRFGMKQAPKSGVDATYTSYGLGLKLAANLDFDLSSQQDPVTETSISYISLSYMPPVFGWKPVEEAVTQQDFVKITFPPNDFVTYNDSLKIQGYVLKGTDVYINGMMVFVGDNLYFSTEVPLNAGKNLVEIKGRLKGADKTLLLKVLRKAKVVIAEEEQINRALKFDFKGREKDVIAKQKAVEDSLKQARSAEEKKRLGQEAAKITQERSALEKQRTDLEEKKQSIEDRKEKVENLVTLGVIEVSPDKNFEIESEITRGEMISWLVKAANLPAPEVTSNVCADVPATHKYAQQIKAAFDLGLVKPDKDNKFYPDRPATEAEGQNFFRAFGVIK